MSIQNDKLMNLEDGQILYNDLRERIEQGGSGTTDYSALTNKPKINNVELSGNKSLHDLGAAAEDDLEDLIAVQDETPTNPVTEIWMTETPPAGIQVPTYAEHKAVSNCIAPDYEDLTFPVAAGQHCIQNGKYYVTENGIQTSEAWTPAHWLEVPNVGGEVEALDKAIIISDTQPTTTDNKLWINNEETEEFTIPTYSEYQALSSAISQNTTSIGTMSNLKTQSVSDLVSAINELYDMIGGGGKTLSSISCVFTQGQNVIYNTDSLDTLKQYLVVTATYSDSSTETVSSTDYTLSGTLSAGTSTITVTYSGKTTTFTVIVTLAPIDLLNVTWANHAITCGQDTDNYNAWSPHNFQYDSVNGCFVFLQCHADRHMNQTYTNWTLTIINPYDSTDYEDVTIPSFNGLGNLFIENGVWTLMPRGQSYAYQSSDMGETWTTLQASIPTYLFGVYKCGETYFGGNDSNNAITYYKSDDMLTWETISFDSSLGYSILCETTFCEYDGKYWAFNRTNNSTLGHPVIMYSTDEGDTWTVFSDQMLHGYRSTVSCYPFQNYIVVADIDRDGGVLYYTKFDGTEFTQLNSWQMPRGGDDFHNVNIVSNYEDTVVLEFMHCVPGYDDNLYYNDQACDNVMLVGSTKTLPSFNFDSYIDTPEAMLAYLNENQTSGLNGGTYTWSYVTGGNIVILSSNQITDFRDEIEFPLNMIKIATGPAQDYNIPIELKNGDQFTHPWNNTLHKRTYTTYGSSIYCRLAVVTINNVMYMYGFGLHEGELPVLIRASCLVDLTSSTPTGVQNSITGESWQESLGFRRVISVNRNNNSAIINVPRAIFTSNTSTHKVALVSYTPVPSSGS